jgi:UV DNA damage endonuclease
LCCAFRDADIKFRHTTARYASTLADRERFLLDIALHNAHALARAIEFCAAHGIGAFRVSSQLLPLYTHPELGWSLAPHADVRAALTSAGDLARASDIRLSFHPDQFVAPGSPTSSTVAASLRELEYHAEVAELIGAEQLTLHGGGAQGGKTAALARLTTNLAHLSTRARQRVVLENDDRVYTVEDLLPVCERHGIALVYDVHHHRCNPDALDVERATDLAAATWEVREPWAHVSSPLGGWRVADPRPHADYIARRDVPACWRDRTMTIDVEAKAKELAVMRLRDQLGAATGAVRERPRRSSSRNRARPRSGRP